MEDSGHTLTPRTEDSQVYQRRGGIGPRQLEGGLGLHNRKRRVEAWRFRGAQQRQGR